MSEASKSEELREEYEFTPEMLRQGVRGKYAERYAAGTNIVRLDADVAEVFPNSEAVNSALRALAGIIRERNEASAA
jgi:hypothetical protein